MKRGLKFLTAITLSLLLVFGSSLGAFADKKTSIHLHADRDDYIVSVQLKGDFSSKGIYNEDTGETTVPMSGGSLYKSTDFSIDVSGLVLYFNIQEQNGNETKWYVGEHIYEGKEGRGTINYWILGKTVGTVIEYHWDENDNELESNVEYFGYVGEPYFTSSKVIPDYQLKGLPTNADGTFIDGLIEVYYIYEPIPQGTVMVHYMFGETKLHDDIELSGSVGTGYVTESKSFDNYDLVSTPDNDTGSFTTETIHVYYLYEPILVQEGSITVNKILTGDTPIPSGTFTFRLVGPTGESSTTRDLSRTGAGTVSFSGLPYGTYTLTEVGWPTNFSIVSGNNAQLSINDETPNITANITNRYTEPTPPPPPTPDRGTVRVHYVDTDENLLDPIFEFLATVGSNYATAARDYEDLELVETPENASGTIIDGIIDVFYVYSPGVEPLVTLEVEEETPLGAPVVPEEEIILTEPIPLAPLPQTGQLPAELFYGLGSLISMIGVAFRKGRKSR